MHTTVPRQAISHRAPTALRLAYDPDTALMYDNPSQMLLALFAGLARAGWDRPRAERFLRRPGPPGLRALQRHLNQMSVRERKSLLSSTWKVAWKTVHQPSMVAEIRRKSWDAALAPAPGAVGRSNRVVHLALLEEASRYGTKEIPVSGPDVAARTACSTATVRRAIRRLNATNPPEVTAVRRRSGHPNRLRLRLRPTPRSSPVGEGSVVAQNAHPLVIEWLLRNACHDAFHPRAGRSLAHHILCSLAEKPANADELVVATEAPLRAVRTTLTLLGNAGAISQSNDRSRWYLCSTTESLEESLTSIARDRGTLGRRSERLASREVEKANRMELVTRHARRLSNERAAVVALHRLSSRRLPWRAEVAAQQSEVAALPRRIDAVVRTAVNDCERAHRAAEWDDDDIEYVGRLVIMGLAWPTGWSSVRDWVLWQVISLAKGEAPCKTNVPALEDRNHD